MYHDRPRLNSYYYMWTWDRVAPGWRGRKRYMCMDTRFLAASRLLFHPNTDTQSKLIRSETNNTQCVSFWDKRAPQQHKCHRTTLQSDFKQHTPMRLLWSPLWKIQTSEIPLLSIKLPHSKGISSLKKMSHILTWSIGSSEMHCWEWTININIVGNCLRGKSQGQGGFNCSIAPGFQLHPDSHSTQTLLLSLS